MRRLGLILPAVLVISGCGGSAAGVGQTAASQLGPQVEQVKAAAMSGDRATAAAKLAQLRASVADLRQRNVLSGAGGAKVLAAAAEVESQLGAPAPTQAPQGSTTAPPAPSVTGAPTPQAPGNDNKGDGNKGDGKGKGKG